MSNNALLGAALTGAALILALSIPASAQGEAGGPVYELRTYTAAEGKLDAVVARFRNHTVKLFEKHGMTNIGYWIPLDEPLSRNTLIYILAHKSREAAKKSWEAFRKDPEWIRVRDESEAGGKLVIKVESVFLGPTDFSRLK
jgi:hypothetical protein